MMNSWRLPEPPPPPDYYGMQKQQKRIEALEAELASCQAVIGGLRVRLDQAERPYFWLGQDVAAEADKTVAWTYTRGKYPLPHVTWVEDPAEFAAAWAKYREPKLPRGVRTNPYYPGIILPWKWMNLGKPVSWPN